MKEEKTILVLEILKELHLKMRKLQMNILLRLVQMRLSLLLTKITNKIKEKEQRLMMSLFLLTMNKSLIEMKHI
jgi:hypothetical protein